MADFEFSLDPMTSSSYDPNFTADISNKMQVPSTIAVDGDTDRSWTSNTRQSMGGESQATMQVPERILLAGGYVFTYQCLLPVDPFSHVSTSRPQSG
jgi:hypothetical protein